MRSQNADGRHLSHLELGDPGADPLVLISGAGSTKEGWGELAAALAERFRVICFDAPGLGGSAPAPGGLDLATLADDVAALLDRLGITTTHVLGWSFGSAVAQHFAVRHPTRLRALVLWSTWARTDGYLRATFTGLRFPFAQGDLDTAVVVLGAVFSPELLDAPEYPLLVEQLRPSLPRTAAEVTATVQQWDRALDHDLTDVLPGIDAPVLVVAGDQDTLAPPRYGRQVAELVRDGRFELFEGPGASHALGLERMPEFVSLVREFLARHALPAPA
jgi:pimeloyl-ACP methyl ester carboxylesterase